MTKVNSELNFYDQVYKENDTRVKRGFSWPYHASTLVKRLIDESVSLNQVQRVLDIGCGDGRHIKYFDYLGINEIVGIDFCPSAIEVCRERFAKKNIKLYQKNLCDKNCLDKLGHFDLILNFSVMCHIRRKNLKTFINNTLNRLSATSYLMLVELGSIPGLHQNKDFKTSYQGHRHYTRVFTPRDLMLLFSPLRLIRIIKNFEEAPGSNYFFNALLFKRP